MAGTTTNFGITYPTNTDYVYLGANAIQTVAQGFDTRLGDVTNYPDQIVNKVSGVSRPVPYATSSNLASAVYSTSTNASVAVTFPASRFTQAPQVTVSPATNSNVSKQSVAIAHSTATSGFTINLYYVIGTNVSATVSVYWTAVQMTSGSAGG